MGPWYEKGQKSQNAPSLLGQFPVSTMSLLKFKLNFQTLGQWHRWIYWLANIREQDPKEIDKDLGKIKGEAEAGNSAEEVCSLILRGVLFSLKSREQKVPRKVYKRADSSPQRKPLAL